MPKQTRRRFSPEQKAVIVRRHLVDKVPVSDLCDEYKIQPSMFYAWQKQALDHVEAAFTNTSNATKASSREAKLEAKVAELEARVAKKDNVIAIISQEHIELKKELGEL